MRSELERRTHDQKLKAALAFDDEDLEANRYGYMSKRQRKQLNYVRRLWKFRLTLTIMFTPIAIIFAILDGYIIGDTASSRFGLCCLIVIVASALSFHALIKIHNFSKDLLKGDVINVGGIIREDYLAGRGELGIRIADQVFKTNLPQRFYGFEYGDKYTIFYAPFSRHILSAQLLEQPISEQEAHPILKANPPIK